MPLSAARFLALVAVISPAASLVAQSAPSHESNPVAAVRHQLEVEHSVGFAVPHLRQTGAATTSAQRDSIAAAMVSAAIKAGSESDRNDFASDILFAFISSAVREGSGVPYTGAASSLLAIARAAPRATARSAASAIYGLADEQFAAAALYELATSERQVAPDALGLIAQSRSPVVRGQIERACQGAALRNAEAESELQDIALRLSVDVGRCARHRLQLPTTSAQTTDPFEFRSVRSLAAALEETGVAAGVIPILRQQQGSRSDATASTRDSIADVLVKFVLRYSHDESRHDAVRGALITLRRSGSSGSSGVPYAGAVASIIRIVRADTSGFQHAAVAALSSMASEQEAVNALQEVANYDRSIATLAVELLSNSPSPAFQEGFRSLCRGRVLSSRNAEETLQARSRAAGTRVGRCATQNP